jgi:starch synthase
MDTTGQDFADNARRFGFFSHVAAQLACDHSPITDWQADILHCHDWTAGLAPAYLARQDTRHRAASVFTIHNLLFQGLFPLHVAAHIDICAPWLAEDPALLHWGRLCFLKAGLHHADFLSTVSPGYASEILAPPASCGMEDVLQARKADLHGILNGVDTRVWNPAIDPLIPARYDAESLELKARNKAALQEAFGLRADSPASLGRGSKGGSMLLGMVGRLTSQKGVDIVLECLPAMMDMGCQLCVLGTGDKQLESAMQQAAQSYPGQVSVRIGFDEAMAHLIEAGADAFLMPSTFEPCGLNQMYSQLYGTPPIVHATGGLADTVRDDKGSPGEGASSGAQAGTGFSFHEATSTALMQAIMRARQAFAQADHWRHIQRNGMALDHSWRARAMLHVQSYAAAMKKRDAQAGSGTTVG